MAKKLVKTIKLQIPAGKANPAPPIGPALGAAGINIMAFCKEYNAKTQDKAGDILPVLIFVYSDKSFTFIIRTYSKQKNPSCNDELVTAVSFCPLRGKHCKTDAGYLLERM